MGQILSILGSVGFNWHVALANFFNFLIILWLLNRFFFKKIGTTLKERHTIIEQGLHNASEAKKALLHAEEEKDAILRKAHQDEAKIIHDAEVAAKEKASHIHAKASEEISAAKLALDEEEKALAHKVEKELRDEAPRIIAELYRTTLKRTMTKEENDALIGTLSS